MAMRSMVLEYAQQHLPKIPKSPSHVGFYIPAPWFAYGMGKKTMVSRGFECRFSLKSIEHPYLGDAIDCSQE